MEEVKNININSLINQVIIITSESDIEAMKLKVQAALLEVLNS